MGGKYTLGHRRCRGVGPELRVGWRHL